MNQAWKSLSKALSRQEINLLFEQSEVYSHDLVAAQNPWLFVALEVRFQHVGLEG